MDNRSKLQAMKQKQKDLPRLRDTRTAYTIATLTDEASTPDTHNSQIKQRKNGVATSLGSAGSLGSPRHVLDAAGSPSVLLSLAIQGAKSPQSRNSLRGTSRSQKKRRRRTNTHHPLSRLQDDDERTNQALKQKPKDDDDEPASTPKLEAHEGSQRRSQRLHVSSLAHC